MTEKIISLLKESDANAWEITDKVTDAVQDRSIFMIIQIILQIHIQPAYPVIPDLAVSYRDKKYKQDKSKGSHTVIISVRTIHEY